MCSSSVNCKIHSIDNFHQYCYVWPRSGLDGFYHSQEFGGNAQLSIIFEEKVVKVTNAIKVVDNFKTYSVSLGINLKLRYTDVWGFQSGQQSR